MPILPWPPVRGRSAKICSASANYAAHRLAWQLRLRFRRDRRRSFWPVPSGVAVLHIRSILGRIARPVYPRALTSLFKVHHLRREVGDKDSRDRNSVVSGTSVSVQLDIGGRRIIQKNK